MNKTLFKKRQIKIILYIVICLWSAVLIKYLVDTTFKEKVKITQVFMDTELDDKSGNLEIIVEHSNKRIKEADKLNLIYYIARLIGMDIEEEIKYFEEEGKCEYYITKEGSAASATIKVSTIVNEDNISNYIIIRLNILNRLNLIDTYKDVIIKGLEEIGITEHEISLEYEGAYEGEIDQERSNNIAKEVINNLHGIKVLEHKEKDMYIVYGYTGMISGYIKSSQNRINIQLAFMYDKDENKTKVYLASPFLNHSY